jgi:hypothetical protein
MKYATITLILFSWFFILIFKRGKKITKIEQFLLTKLNQKSIFKITISSFQHQFPFRFLITGLEITNKNKLLQIRVQNGEVVFALLNRIKCSVQEMKFLQFNTVDIGFTDFVSNWRIIPKWVGLKLINKTIFSDNQLTLQASLLVNFLYKRIVTKANIDIQSMEYLLSIFNKENADLFNSLSISGSKYIRIDFSYNYLKPLNYSFQLVPSEVPNFAIKYKQQYLLDYLQRDIEQIIIDNCNEIRVFKYTVDNPDFISVSETPDLLLKTIITTEDPNFLFHKGFEFDSFGYALANNLANKKFVRGGSTITMQLVRNLYLNHKKTFSRKIEEVIITWIIEDELQISKEKILELYLNRIEMGPGVYGIKKASLFYFNKQLRDLSFIECLVLSYVIPRPKFFLEALQMQSEQLKTNLKQHIRKYSILMMNRALVEQNEFYSIDYKIKFSQELGILAL